MKLITRVTLRLAIVLLPIMIIWGTVFFFYMVKEINDETDDSLEDYAEMLIRRTLAGKELPPPGNGSNNTYSIEPLPDSAGNGATISFKDRRIYIHEKKETEPARELTMTFNDSRNNAYRLVVSTPTFEREDLLRTIFTYIVILYILLMLTILAVT
ncbi:MAG: sensor histidine kinase, partial [Bacteroidaceae bacterium]|nr:sensor histidine kinase [Bacteroidaceae bacterium]